MHALYDLCLRPCVPWVLSNLISPHVFNYRVVALSPVQVVPLPPVLVKDSTPFLFARLICVILARFPFVSAMNVWVWNIRSLGSCCRWKQIKVNTNIK